MGRSSAAGAPAWAVAMAAAALACAQGPQQLDPLAPSAPFMPADQTPEEFRDVKLEERLGASVPLDVRMIDQDGKPVLLAEKFAGDLPVVLTLNYFDCPMLCKLELNGLVKSMRLAAPTLGKEYRVVTVSIDPRDNAAKAKQGQERYLKDYDRPLGGSRPWEFLVGPEAEVRRLAAAVGFGYKWMPKQREYAHHAAVFVCSPTGKLCRVLYGVEYDPATLKMALLEASEGRVGSVVDRVLMLCYQWNPHTGKYGVAMAAMRIVGGSVALAIAGTLTWLFRRDRQLRAAAGEAATGTGDGS